MDVQSKEPSKQSSFKKKHVPLYKGKNCKDTICENIDSKSQISRKSDKNCPRKYKAKEAQKSHAVSDQ